MDDRHGGFDPFSPTQIAEKVGTLGVAKAHMPVLQTLMPGVVIFSSRHLLM